MARNNKKVQAPLNLQDFVQLKIPIISMGLSETIKFIQNDEISLKQKQNFT